MSTPLMWLSGYDVELSPGLLLSFLPVRAPDQNCFRNPTLRLRALGSGQMVKWCTVLKKIFLFSVFIVLCCDWKTLDNEMYVPSDVIQYQQDGPHPRWHHLVLRCRNRQGRCPRSRAWLAVEEVLYTGIWPWGWKCEQNLPSSSSSSSFFLCLLM